MSRLILFTAFTLGILYPHLNFSQRINGKVILGPKETDSPLGGVRIDVQGLATTLSETETGIFQLNLPNLRPGTKVPLDITKDGYAVINREATHPYVPDNPLERVYIHMAPNDRRDEMALQFYKITVERNIAVNFDAAAKEFAREANYEAIAKLYVEKEAALNQVESLVARLARFDPQDASEDLDRAMVHYQNGEIEQALLLLDIDKITARIDTRKEVLAEIVLANQKDIETLMLGGEMAISNLEFEKAKEYFTAAISRDSSHAENLLQVGIFLSDQNEFQLAERYFRMALSKELPPELEANILNSLGIALKDLHRDSEAMEIYHRALQLERVLAKKGCPEFRSLLAGTLSNLGNVQSNVNASSKAIKSFEESIKIDQLLIEENFPGAEVKLATTYNNLGIAYADVFQYEKAEKAYHDALAIRRRILGIDTIRYGPDISMTLNNLGNLYSLTYQFEKSAQFLEEALVFERKLASLNPNRFEPSFAGTLTNLGISYNSMGRFEEALIRYAEALALKRKLAAQNPNVFLSSLAATLGNLGNVSRNSGQVLKAIEYDREARSIYQQLVDSGSERFIEYLALATSSLGNSYVEAGQFDDAIRYYKEAIQLEKSLSKTAPKKFKPEIAKEYYNLGIAYQSSLRYEKAIGYLKEAIRLNTELLSAGNKYRSLNLGDNYYALGFSYGMTYEFTLAVAAFRRADSAFRLTPQIGYARQWSEYAKMGIEEFSATDAYPLTLDQKGLDFLDLGEMDSARIYFEEALKEFEKLIQEDSIERIMENISYTYEHMVLVFRKPEDRLALQTKALKFKEAELEHFLSDSILKENLVSAYVKQATYANFAKVYKKAESSARRAIELDPEATDAIPNLAVAILLQGKFEEAKRWYLNYADKPWVDDRNKTFREVFLSDLDELEAAGITHPDIAKIRELLAE